MNLRAEHDPENLIFDPILFPARLRYFNREAKPCQLSPNSVNSKTTENNKYVYPLLGTALYIFPPNNRFRIMLHNLISKKCYRFAINSLGVASSLLLMAASPMRPKDERLNFSVSVIEYVGFWSSDTYLLLPLGILPPSGGTWSVFEWRPKLS